MMFAQITPALITGAFTNRVRFQAYLIFLVAWLLLVYFPMVHMIWGGGLLAQWGVLDFAGGIVVHCIAGFAALASVMFVGRRRVAGTSRAAQHPAGGAGHGAALVRLVRVQRRQRVAGRRRDVTGVSQHRRRGFVRGDRVADRGVDLREEAEIRGLADRRRSPAWLPSHRRPVT